MARKIGGIVSMDTLGMALGAATSGLITGMIPIPDFGISGVSEIIVGWAGQKFIGKTGIMKSYFKGIMIAGIANAISGFIPQIGGTIHPIKATGRTQVNGRIGGRTGDMYVHRNPFVDVSTETVVYPKGTSNLAKMPRGIPMNTV